MTPKQRKMEAERVAKLCIGRKTVLHGYTIEWAEVNAYNNIVIRFKGFGLAPFREARYTPKEVLEMIGEK